MDDASNNLQNNTVIKQEPEFDNRKLNEEFAEQEEGGWVKALQDKAAKENVNEDRRKNTIEANENNGSGKRVRSRLDHLFILGISLMALSFVSAGFYLYFIR